MAVLSGPNMPRRSARAAGGHGDRKRGRELAESLQDEINSVIFRVYVNQDLVGTELAAAAKNVIALAAGGVDGLGLGDNAKSGIVTRGLAEMARLGEACGGRARPSRVSQASVTSSSPAGRATGATGGPAS